MNAKKECCETFRGGITHLVISISDIFSAKQLVDVPFYLLFPKEDDKTSVTKKTLTLDYGAKVSLVFDQTTRIVCIETVIF